MALKLPLSRLCFCPDAQKRTNNLSPVPSEIIEIILHDRQFWPQLNQLINTVKPLVDAIGNLESQEVSLADCMLEFIRCAQVMSQLKFDGDGDEVGFWMHAKSAFNRRFHAMNTDLHILALFLHPLCQKLAISEASGGRTFAFMVQAALGIAKQWRWSKERAKQLVEDLKLYYQCKGPFTGMQSQGLDWWECLPISSEGLCNHYSFNCSSCC